MTIVLPAHYRRSCSEHVETPALQGKTGVCSCVKFAAAILASPDLDAVFGTSVSAVEDQGGRFVGVCECGLRYGVIDLDAPIRLWPVPQ